VRKGRLRFAGGVVEDDLRGEEPPEGNIGILGEGAGILGVREVGGIEYVGVNIGELGVFVMIEVGVNIELVGCVEVVVGCDCGVEKKLAYVGEVVVVLVVVPLLKFLPNKVDKAP